MTTPDSLKIAPEELSYRESLSQKQTNIFLKKIALTLSASLFAACTHVAPNTSALEQEVQQLRQELEEVKNTPPQSVATPAKVEGAEKNPALGEKAEVTGESIERRFTIDDNTEKVELQDIIGNITVEVIDTSEAQELVMRGDERLIRGFEQIEAGKGEKFLAPRIGSSSYVNGVLYIGGNGNAGGINIINGVIHSAQYDYMVPKESIPVFLLKLHEGKSLHIDSRSGTVQVGDTKGDVTLELSGVGRARLGKVHSGDLRVSGSGDVTAAFIEGSLDITVSGSGEVHVLDGKIGSADIAVSGAGDVSVDAHVQHLKARVSGSGSVHVKSASTVQKDESGSGEVEVGSAR